MSGPDSGGLRKLQEIRFTGRSAHAALEAVTDALALAGGELVSLSLRSGTVGLDVVLRLSDLSDAAALRVCERLAARRTAPRLEHLWVRG